MFYYIDQLCTTSFPSGLVKTKSDFIVGSGETVLGKWTLVVAVSSVDAYPFLAFTDLTCHLTGCRNTCFLVALCCLIVRRPNLEEATKRLLHQQVKTGIVLVLCHAWKCVPTVISSGVNISEVPGCYLLRQMSSQWGSQKLHQGLVSYEITAYLSIFNLFLTQLIMAILSKGC